MRRLLARVCLLVGIAGAHGCWSDEEGRDVTDKTEDVGSDAEDDCGCPEGW